MAKPTRRERIVSLAPSATSILVALGAKKALVGVSRWCPTVAPVAHLPQLGDCWQIDPSAVRALSPHLIVGSVPYRAETLAQLLELPGTFVATNPRTLDDIFREIRFLGRLTGRAEQADQLITRMQAFFELVARCTRRLPRLRVYAEAWPKPRIASPPWVAELIALAGGDMIVPAGQKVDDLEVARRDPEVILLAWTAAGERSRRASALENVHWQHTSAVRNGRVYVVRDELLNTPGPPLMDGLRVLVRTLHPEVVLPANRPPRDRRARARSH